MPVDDKTRDQSWKDWTRRDMQRSLHPQGPPTHLSQEELARPACAHARTHACARAVALL